MNVPGLSTTAGTSEKQPFVRQPRKASVSAVRSSDTKEIEHPQRMASLEKLQGGARRRDEGPLL